MKSFSQNSLFRQADAVVMYVDMNSFFASCEQQDNPALRNKPIGVCTYDSPNAAVIAASAEAKRTGIKTGMRMSECRALCPQIIAVPTNPVRYRRYHIEIMKVLHSYCDDVMAKSIDEALMNFTSYKLVYKDFIALAKQIKESLRLACGDYVKCSVGIAPNSFLAKLGTELQKPDGLVHITPENIDGYLATMKLTDLPGIASRNERRLNMIGIRSPLDMRNASETLLRKAFGGIVGNYWYRRLHFAEVDIYKNTYKSMSATRTMSRQQTASAQTIESMLISLCTKLEQRMVKQQVFCNEVGFFIKYADYTSWDTKIKLPHPVQDAIDMRSYIHQKMHQFEAERNTQLFNPKTQNIGVYISSFVSDMHVQYSLFDNKIHLDKLRKVMYGIKDKYGKNSVRKACETIEPKVMKDAIGFGSVKDLYEEGVDGHFNKYMLEEDE